MLITHIQAGTPNHDIKITNNTADTSPAPTPLQNGPLAYVVNSRDVLIQGNRSTDSFSAGMYLEGNKNVLVQSNDISGIKDGYAAIRLRTRRFFYASAVPNEDVSIVGNNIHDNHVGPVASRTGSGRPDARSAGAVGCISTASSGNDVGIRNNDDEDAGRRHENNSVGTQRRTGRTWAGRPRANKGTRPPPFVGPPPVVDTDPWT